MRSIYVMLIGFGLLLASCGTTVTAESIVAEIAKDCGIVVTVADIAALVTANPTVAGAAGFAKLVCDAFQKTKMARGGDILQTGVLDINGVHVHYTVK